MRMILLSLTNQRHVDYDRNDYERTDRVVRDRMIESKNAKEKLCFLIHWNFFYFFRRYVCAIM